MSHQIFKNLFALQFIKFRRSSTGICVRARLGPLISNRLKFIKGDRKGIIIKFNTILKVKGYKAWGHSIIVIGEPNQNTEWKIACKGRFGSTNFRCAKLSSRILLNDDSYFWDEISEDYYAIIFAWSSAEVVNRLCYQPLLYSLNEIGNILNYNFLNLAVNLMNCHNEDDDGWDNHKDHD